MGIRATAHELANQLRAFPQLRRPGQEEVPPVVRQLLLHGFPRGVRGAEYRPSMIGNIRGIAAQPMERVGTPSEVDAAGRQNGIEIGTADGRRKRSEEHTSELQSLKRLSYAVFYFQKKNAN